MPVAGNAWIRCTAVIVIVYERLNDRLSKLRLGVKYIKWNIQKVGNSAGVCHLVRRAAAIRYSFLLHHAQSLGAQYLATGHYAGVRQRGGRYELLKGSDPDKDQSYVLYTLNQDKLAHILFPVGDFTKEEVRVLAKEFGLPVATKHESQDLCFVADGDHKGFLQRHNTNGFIPGPILDPDGNILGQHSGLPFYTIGQRKGLGISADQPLFVIQKDRARNAIVVGPREALEQTNFRVRDLNWISGVQIPAEKPVDVKIRYKAPAVPGFVFASADKESVIKLTNPVRGVTPGQGAVFYEGDVCLGGGIIADSPEDLTSITSPASKQPKEL